MKEDNGLFTIVPYTEDSNEEDFEIKPTFFLNCAKVILTTDECGFHIKSINRNCLRSQIVKLMQDINYENLEKENKIQYCILRDKNQAYTGYTQVNIAVFEHPTAYKDEHVIFVLVASPTNEYFCKAMTSMNGENDFNIESNSLYLFKYPIYSMRYIKK